ncbi:MAG: hypothetical protein SCH98_16855 [Deferrisomatales bacterium]|nr:hypothetical protein [Deferrisomatales bacterium]
MSESCAPLVRICMFCRRIFLGEAEDREVWVPASPECRIPEDRLTHGLCPECLVTRLGPELEAVRARGGGRGRFPAAAEEMP